MAFNAKSNTQSPYVTEKDLTPPHKAVLHMTVEREGRMPKDRWNEKKVHKGLKSRREKKMPGEIVFICCPLIETNFVD